MLTKDRKRLEKMLSEASEVRMRTLDGETVRISFGTKPDGSPFSERIIGGATLMFCMRIGAVLSFAVADRTTLAVFPALSVSSVKVFGKNGKYEIPESFHKLRPEAEVPVNPYDGAAYAS